MSTQDQRLFRAREIIRAEAGAPGRPEPDQLAVEEPLEIRVDTRPVSITMRTPGHDEELALGFLVSEGLIRSAGDILKVAARAGEAENVLDVFLAPGVTIDFARLTRHVFASSSCGLCGKATIEAVRQQFSPMAAGMEVRAEILLGLPGKLQQAQHAFNRTGGLHAAALFEATGNLVALREDVGRHNAVDKVLGYAVQKNLLPLERHVLLVSGRASFEILQKALAGRIPIVAAVSAPSTLAVEFAEANRQTLVGFLRGQRMNIYAGAERIRFAR